MNMNEIIKYIENPPEKDERFVINDTDYGAKVDFSTDTLHSMIDILDEKEKEHLLEKVIEVCTIWDNLRISPNNCIGTMARYQLARDYLI